MGLTLALQYVGAANSSLNDLKSTYEAEVRNIKKEHDAHSEKMLKAYGSLLDRTIKTLKQQGDPDNVIGAFAEKKRFNQEKTVPKMPPAALPRDIQKIQALYHDHVTRADRDQGKRLVMLTEKYAGVLDRKMKSLVAQEELDLSLNVKDEKKRVAFILADLEIQLEQLGVNPSVSCRVCKGTGKSVRACKACSGTGRCGKCLGKGGFKRFRLDSRPFMEKCSSCKGKKSCPICRGTRKTQTKCHHCSGRGKNNSQ